MAVEIVVPGELGQQRIDQGRPAEEPHHDPAGEVLVDQQICAARFGLEASAVFRPPNSPAAAQLVQEVRRATSGEAAHGGAPDLLHQLRRRRAVGRAEHRARLQAEDYDPDAAENGRIEVEGIEHFTAMRDDGRPGLIFSSGRRRRDRRR
jgi:lauroyl/myristoyl acyltransferase